jgi:hypothetical protein
MALENSSSTLSFNTMAHMVTAVSNYPPPTSFFGIVK